MLTIIEGESNVWMVISVDDELRIYSRAEAGDWGELSLSEESEQVDPEKSFMLEELYGRESGQEEEDEEAGPDDEEEEPDAEEDEPDDEEETDEDGSELAEDEESEDGEDEEPEEEEKPRRRRAANAKSGRTAARRK